MSYDFTSILERRGRDALAVDGLGQGAAPALPKEGFDPIPMWIADMNFPTLPAISQAMAERAAHPLYGYFAPPEAYYDAILTWQREQNGVEGLSKACIGYENGVLGGVVSALNVMCCRGDGVLVHAPTYVGFTRALERNGYHIVSSPLRQDEAGIWRMDLEDMEEKLRSRHIHAAILCSPHNPCGRVWEREELEAAMTLYQKYDVSVISDEIWSDLTLDGHRHIPTQSVSEDARRRTVALYAPSKTFNLAGLVGSYHIIYDPALRDRVRAAGAMTNYNNMNVLSMHALMAAYSAEGQAWLRELRQVLSDNVHYAWSYIHQRFPGVDCALPQGTYMLFLDCSGWCQAQGRTIEQVERAAWAVGVAVQDGRMFHGPCHLRMNLALPRSRVEEAMERLDRYVFNAAK